MADCWFIYKRSYGGYYHAMASNVTSRSVSWVKGNGRNGRCDRREVVFMADNERAVLDVLSQLEQSRQGMQQQQRRAENQHGERVANILARANRPATAQAKEGAS